MKKSLLLILCTLISGGLWADSRNAQQAQQLAAEFLHSNVRHQAPAAQQATLKHCHTAAQKNGQPAFYVFNRGTDSGFVIVSAESRTHTILGYANSGHFDANNLPDNMRAWLEGYSEAIHYAASLPERQATPRPQHAPKTYPTISPLCSTRWGQNNPYNLQCPEDNGQLCVTGCVATAAAQIMKYHSYPTQGKGSNSYYWYRSANDSVLLSANFGNSTYNWSQMLDEYDSNASAAQKNAVAKLMSDCGIACYMGYGTGSSSAYTPNMVAALVENFRYNAGIHSIYKDYMKEADFLDEVVADLQAGRPVWFNGRTKSDEGHAFICDGIDANGLVHINWGWNGYCDNYFRVSALDPDDQGTGGSAGNEAYTEQVTAYTHITPSEGGQYYPTITADTLYVNNTRVGRNDAIRFNVEIFQNLSLLYWEGIMAIQVYQNGNLYKTYSGDFDLKLYHRYYYYDVWFNQSFNDLPVGEYEIVPVAKSMNSYMDPTPVPIMVKYTGAFRCPMTVTNDSVFLTLPEAEIPVEVEVPDPTTYTFSNISGYYHPEYTEGVDYWEIQLETSDFFTTDSTNQMVLLFGINCSSSNAFIGSYLSDETAEYRCDYANMFAGNIDSYSFYPSDDGEVTFVYHSNTQTYVVHYRIQTAGKTFVGKAEIPKNMVSGSYGTDYGTHAKYDNITLNLTRYNSLTTTKAMELIDSHSVGWVSPIPYVISGSISSIENTPAQIKQYKNCRLYISDGTTPIYAYNTKWLNNTNFTTGNEISVGGQATIVGPLKYYNATTKEIQAGYFCKYKAASGSAIESVYEKSGKSVQKVLRNGAIYIIRNNSVYTIDGIKVND